MLVFLYLFPSLLKENLSSSCVVSSQSFNMCILSQLGFKHLSVHVSFSLFLRLRGFEPDLLFGICFSSTFRSMLLPELEDPDLWLLSENFAPMVHFILTSLWSTSMAKRASPVSNLLKSPLYFLFQHSRRIFIRSRSTLQAAPSFSTNISMNLIDYSRSTRTFSATLTDKAFIISMQNVSAKPAGYPGIFVYFTVNSTFAIRSEESCGVQLTIFLNFSPLFSVMLVLQFVRLQFFHLY